MIALDRFEGDWAVIETDSGMIEIERKFIADDIREGDIISETPEGYYIKDYQKTEERRLKLSELRNKLLKGGAK